MSNVVTCTRIGEALMVWLANATTSDRARLCQLLACSGGDPASGDTITNVAFNPTTNLLAVTTDQAAWNADLSALDNDVLSFTFNDSTRVLTLVTPQGNYPVTIPAGGGSGGLSDVATADSLTIDFTGLGTTASPLTAAAKISPAAGNQLTSNATGLFVPPPAGIASVTSTDSSTIDINGTGTTASPLTAAAKISPTSGNQLTADSGGLFVPASSGGGLTAVASTDSSTIDFSGSGTTASPLTAAAKVSSTAGNALTSNATGLFVPTVTPGISVVTSADSTTIDFTGLGTTASPLTAAAKISTSAGNQLTSNATGLFVPAPSGGGITSVTSTDSSTIDFSGSGTSGSPLTAAVKISTTPGNVVLSNSSGLYVTPGVSGVGFDYQTGELTVQSNALSSPYLTTDIPIGPRQTLSGVWYKSPSTTNPIVDIVDQTTEWSQVGRKLFWQAVVTGHINYSGANVIHSYDFYMATGFSMGTSLGRIRAPDPLNQITRRVGSVVSSFVDQFDISANGYFIDNSSGAVSSSLPLTTLLLVQFILKGGMPANSNAPFVMTIDAQSNMTNWP